jgi:peptidoglycan/LPS O-acetylase OafA/YrhL
MSRWIGSAIVWLCAPLAGLAAINLPFFVYFLIDGRLRPVFLQHAWLAVVAVLFVVVWAGLVWWLARRHSGRARQAHVIVACLLAMAGSALAFVGGHAKQAGVGVERIR